MLTLQSVYPRSEFRRPLPDYQYIESFDLKRKQQFAYMKNYLESYAPSRLVDREEIGGRRAAFFAENFPEKAPNEPIGIKFQRENSLWDFNELLLKSLPGSMYRLNERKMHPQS